MTELQHRLYCHYLESKAARKLLSGRTTGVLSAITSLKKLCNHPKASAKAGRGGGERLRRSQHLMHAHACASHRCLQKHPPTYMPACTRVLEYPTHAGTRTAPPPPTHPTHT